MKKIIILLFLLCAVYSKSEDIWKKSTGISTPASIWNIAVSDNKYIYASSGQILYKSTDDGNNWITIIFEAGNIGRNNLFVQRIKCDKIGNLYILTNNAFYRLDNSSDTAIMIVDFEYSYNAETSVSISDDNKTVVVFDSREIWVSHDFGITWKQINLIEEYHPNLRLISVTYDEKYGIIKNYITGSWYVDGSYAYYSTDDGLIWHQMKTIPGTNIPVNEIQVVDSTLWIVGGNLYNFETKNYTQITIDRMDKFRKNSKGYYITDLSAIYFSSDEGASWDDITNDVFKDNAFGWIDAFDVDVSGTIYAGTRYERMKKSDDNGQTWQRIYINTAADLYFNGIKYVNNEVFANDHKFFRYVSQDNGKSWDASPLIMDNYYVYHLDVNSKGEMVYDDGAKIAYSSDKGITWKYLDTTSVNRAIRYQLNIFDNGVIIGTPESYYSSYMYPQADKQAQLLHVTIQNPSLLANGNYFSFHRGFFKVINETFDNDYMIHSSIKDILGFKPDFLSYAISKNEELYVGTNKGLFKSPSVSNNFSFIALENQSIDQIFVDDNNYLYVNSDGNIFMSRDDGQNWKQINSNLGLSGLSHIYAFGDSKIIAKNNDVYYADFKNVNFLNLTDSITNDVLYYNESNEYSFLIKDDLDKPVESARVVIYNNLTSEFDTVYTDLSGKAVYNLKMNYYNPNVTRSVTFYSYAIKNGYAQSNINSKLLRYQAIKKNLYCTGKTYTVVKPDTSVDITIGMVKKTDISPYYEHVYGTLVIKNEFSGLTESILYNSDDFYKYSITIPPDSELGLYRISLKGINNQQDTTTEHIMYLVVTDTLFTKTVDIKEEINEDDLVILPNPASDYITIKSNNIVNSNLQIYSLRGMLMYESEYRVKIDISNLTAGTYFLRINKKIYKFIKK